ncbi:hypothetical protein [Maridesulfovibrio sp.]|uniref:hypothetical protein n=1 Tax=Maridesulfovibrio sp. TaxID=2795000 RepID=UPI0039F0753E
MPITFHKEDGAAVAVPDADNKVTFFVDETGNPAVKHADGSSSKVLIDGDAFTTSEKPLLTYVANGYEGTDITVLIANYDDYMSGVEFGFKPQGGTIAVNEGTIIWTLPQLDVAGQLTLDVTAREFGKATSTSTATVDVALIPFNVAGLGITSPANDAVGVKETADVTADSPVSSDPAYNHISTSWYVSPDGTKANAVAKSVDDAINLNSWKIPKGMAEGTVYKLWREIKMSNGETVFTLVSDKVSFTTIAKFNAWLYWDGAGDGASTTVETSIQIDEYILLIISATEVLSLAVSNTGAEGVRLKRLSRESEVSNLLTVDNAITVVAGTATNVCGVVIDENNIMVGYRNSTGHGRFKIVSKTGGVWTAGDEQTLTDTSFSNPHLILVDANTILCTFEEATTSNIYVISITGSGASWTAGIEDFVVGYVLNKVALVRATAGEALLLYGSSVGGDTRGIPLTGSGASWSANNYFVIDAVTAASDIDADMLSDGTVVCFSRDADGLGSRINFLSKNGSWTVTDTVNVPNATSVAHHHIATVTDEAMLVSYNTSPAQDGYITVITKTDEGWAVGHTETYANSFGSAIERLNDDSAIAVYPQNFNSLLTKAIIAG